MSRRPGGVHDIAHPPASPPRTNPLPPGILPRGLSRAQAACYVGVSTTKFDDLVADRQMPRPKRIGGRRVWDVRAIDAAFDRLDEGSGSDDAWGAMAL
jgi:predicted DNA-binding transcriptional regulator AlpA